jgi:hypothetical protein
VPAPENLVWAYPQPERSPYDWEWDDLIAAIRDDKPYNEVKRGAEASLVASMGRFSAHTGQTVTFDQMMNHDHEFAPDVDKLTMDGPAPLIADAEGKYPLPEPGIKTKTTREYWTNRPSTQRLAGRAGKGRRISALSLPQLRPAVLSPSTGRARARRLNRCRPERDLKVPPAHSVENPIGGRA